MTAETTAQRKSRERSDIKRKKTKLLKSWKKYLGDSKLSTEEQKIRAKQYTNRGVKVPND